MKKKKPLFDVMAEEVPLSSPPPEPLIPFLPDEISVLCLARVPVTSHTAIAQVSRSWRSFVRSPSFLALRSEIAVTELVLTVHTYDASRGGRNRWYHLHPYKIPFPLPLPQQNDEGKFTCASIGPHLFCIGGNSSRDSLQIYDGCLRRWSHGPPTSASGNSNTAVVAGGRIHVIHRHNESVPAESLDPTGTRWDPIPPIPAHLIGNRYWWCWTAILDGKLLVQAIDVRGRLFGVAFDPDAAKWAYAPRWSREDVPFEHMTVLRGVPYLFRSPREGIVGYGSDGQWRPVEGGSVAELIKRITKHEDVRLLTFGGLLCLVGKEKEPKDGSVVIVFAGIEISRTADGGFRGSIMWLDSSLKHSEVQSFHECVVMEL